MTIREDRASAAVLANRWPGDDAAPLLKVCGVTEEREVDALTGNAADLVGLWYGVTGGPADLELDAWAALAKSVASHGLVPVLVTFSKDVEQLGAALDAAPVAWVQLHGYQMPGVVRAIKAAAPAARVIKVLHVRGAECVEAPLLASYEKAGVDLFLFDVVASDGRVGSTGESLDVEYVMSLAERITIPFLIAGGISKSNRSRFDALVSHPRYAGIDVDTNARGGDGKIASANVKAIGAAWKAEA
jgi:phosphoribosylanthranilate isomerase